VARAACRAGWAAWATWTTKPSGNSGNVRAAFRERPSCFAKPSRRVPRSYTRARGGNAWGGAGAPPPCGARPSGVRIAHTRAGAPAGRHYRAKVTQHLGPRWPQPLAAARLRAEPLPPGVFAAPAYPCPPGSPTPGGVAFRRVPGTPALLFILLRARGAAGEVRPAPRPSSEAAPARRLWGALWVATAAAARSRGNVGLSAPSLAEDVPGGRASRGNYTRGGFPPGPGWALRADVGGGCIAGVQEN
jgi:hypothetical protein